LIASRPHFGPRGAFGVRAARAGRHLPLDGGVEVLAQLDVELALDVLIPDERTDAAHDASEHRHDSSPRDA